MYFKEASSRTSSSIARIYVKIHALFLLLTGVLKQLHGSFMVIAWLMAASAGVLMPRYMKKTWVGKQFMKKDLWFVVSCSLDKCIRKPTIFHDFFSVKLLQFHQGLMVLAWCLTVVGFIIIFVDVGGWVSESVSENPHPLIGCITTGTLSS